MGKSDPLQKLGIFDVAALVEFLNPIDIVRLRRVSKLWNGVLGSEYICTVALLSHFPSSKEAKDIRDKNMISTSLPSASLSKQPQNAPEENSKRAKGKGKGRVKGKSKELETLMGASTPFPNSKSTPAAVIGFARATFRLHARAIGRPTMIHRYRLHHICEKAFASTPHYLFWCESNRKIWQQTIGEGIGGRRSLKLGGLGNRIAHVHQITAVENIPGRKGGLVVLLYREITNWGLEMAALDFDSNEIVWKTSLSDQPMTLERTKGWVYCIMQGLDPMQIMDGPGPQRFEYTLVVHCVRTGKLLCRTVLKDSWPKRKISGPVHEILESPHSYAIFDSTATGKRPDRIILTFDRKGLSQPGQEASNRDAYKVLVYSLATELGGEGALLKELNLVRRGIPIGTALIDKKSLRIDINSGPSCHHNIMLVENIPHPHVVSPKTRKAVEKLDYPTLSVWILDPEEYNITEIRRYQSMYGDEEFHPSFENRDMLYPGGTYATFTRLEALEVDSGVSWLIFDELKTVKPRQQFATEDDEYDEDSDSDEARIPFSVLRPWNYAFQSNGSPMLSMRSKIDTITYQEVFDGSEFKGNVPAVADDSPGLTGPSGSKKRKRSSNGHTDRSRSTTVASSSSAASFFSAHGSTPYPGSSFDLMRGSLSPASSTGNEQAKERWFKQVTRHKLQQPEIMRRRRRTNLGEEEEDWGMMPVSANPAIYLGGNDSDLSTAGERSCKYQGDEDSRFMVILTRAKGWNSMVLCLDFDPDW